jgi:hypothetical protein
MVAPRRPRGSDRVPDAIERVRRHVGARGLAGALVPALLWRLRVHLFASYRHRGGLAGDPDSSDHIERLTRPNELSAADRGALREYGGDVLLARVEKRFAQGDWVAVARRDGALACCCWVHETSTYPPGAQGAAAFLQGAFTLEPFRGKGLFPRTLLFVVRVLEQERPGRPVYIEAALDNLSSRRAIEKAGFVRAGLRITSPWFQRWFPARTRPARDRGALPSDPFRNGS